MLCPDHRKLGQPFSAVDELKSAGLIHYTPRPPEKGEVTMTGLVSSMDFLLHKGTGADATSCSLFKKENVVVATT